jgi:hypothetical protein
MSLKRKKPTIYAFGFDKILSANPPGIEQDEFTMKFIPFSSPASLEESDGHIIPSGIFEVRSEEN